MWSLTVFSACGQFSSIQKRQDYPDVSEMLQGQVTELVNVT